MILWSPTSKIGSLTIWFALSSGVFCLWLSFIGAVLSVIKVYCISPGLTVHLVFVRQTKQIVSQAKKVQANRKAQSQQSRWTEQRDARQNIIDARRGLQVARIFFGLCHPKCGDLLSVVMLSVGEKVEKKRSRVVFR